MDGVRPEQIADPGREGRARDPDRAPIWRRRRVVHNCVDRMSFCQRPVEGNAGGERLNGLVARVRESGRRLEGDACSPIAKGKIGRVIEF